MMSESASSENPTQSEQPGRRNVLVELVTGFISFVLIVVPSAIGGLFFLDPLVRGRRSAAGGGSENSLDGFVKVSLSADSIPDDGSPVPLTIRADKVDAWNLHKNVPIGSVWLRRDDQGRLQAFNAVCPHLGCRVKHRPAESDFYCPCHESRFELDGAKTNDTPPRNMDSLEIVTATDGQKDELGKEIWVKYQDFKGGVKKKQAI